MKKNSQKRHQLNILGHQRAERCNAFMMKEFLTLVKIATVLLRDLEVSVPPLCNKTHRLHVHMLRSLAEKAKEYLRHLKQSTFPQGGTSNYHNSK